MDWTVLLHLLPYIISLIVSGGVGTYAWRRRDVAGARSYAWVAFSQASWTLGYIFELFSPSLGGKIFWDNFQFIGGVGCFIAFLTFVFQYTGRKLRRPLLTWGLLLFWPVLFQVLVFTNSWHGWVRPAAWLKPGEPFAELVYDFTPIVWAWALYGYALFFTGLVFLIQRFFRLHRLYRAQIVIIITGTLIPLIGTILTLVGMTVTSHRDTTPFTFVLSSLVVAWGLFRYRLFALGPVARDTVIDNMRDSVVVLDSENRVVDLNPAAQVALGRPASELLGQPISQVSANWPHLVEAFWDVEEIQTEFALDVQGQQRHVDMRLSPLRDRAGRLSGRLVVVRDITQRKQAEQALRQAHEELERRVQERTAELQAAYEELRNREERYRTLFENAKDAILILQGEHFVECNQATEQMFGLPCAEILGKSLHDLSPARQPDGRDSRKKVQEKIAAALAGTAQSFEWVHRHQNGTCFDAEVGLNRLLLDGQWMLQAIVRDVSERKRAEQAPRRYAERLAVLREIDRGILAAQSPEDIARAALSRIRQLIPCNRAGVTMIDQIAHEAVVLALDMEAESAIQEGDRISLDLLEADLAQVRHGQVILLKDLPSRNQSFQTLYREGICTYVTVPLVSQGELVGTLNFGLSEAHTFTQEHESIALQVADQLAVALQQAWLRQEIQRYTGELEKRVAARTRELWAMYEVMAIASQPLDLPAILDRALERVLDALQSQEGFILLVEKDGDQEKECLRLVAQQGLPADMLKQIESRPPDQGLGGWIIQHGEPLVISNIAVESPMAVLDSAVPPRFFIGAPIQSSGHVLGVLSVLRETTQPSFSREELDLLVSLAEQVGIVVESGQLRQRAEQAVVLEERQRLARDLHDSVTQSIYSLTLLAEAGQRMVQAGDTSQVQRNQVRLSEIAQQALQEMRLLVYEMRPLPLKVEGLIRALQHRLEAVERRAGVEAKLSVQGEIDLPPHVEEALYRIAQEALNNALKHAHASAVAVTIRTQGRRVELEVEDNGQGFEQEGAQVRGGLGLTTMQERAESLGGEFTIHSQPGGGTTVKVKLEVASSK